MAAGEVLAVLDDTDYRLSNERAQAALAVAEANRAHALAEKERAENLLKTGGITDKDHLSAQVALQVAEASRGPGEGGGGHRRPAALPAQIRAPFAGRVAKRQADPGAMLASGHPALHLRGRRGAGVPRLGALRPTTARPRWAPRWT